MSINLAIYQIARLQVQKDSKLHSRRRKTLKYYVSDGLQEESAKQVGSSLVLDEIRTKTKIQTL